MGATSPRRRRRSRMNEEEIQARSQFNWSMAAILSFSSMLCWPPHRLGADLTTGILLILFLFRARHWFRVWVALDNQRRRRDTLV